MGMETMRRELENVARGSQGGAIKGDRGTSSYSFTLTVLKLTDWRERWFRMVFAIFPSNFSTLSTRDGENGTTFQATTTF